MLSGGFRSSHPQFSYALAINYSHRGFLFQAAKICNNLAMAISMLGISEALALGQSLGIKASVLTQIFNSSSARCWSRYLPLFPVKIS